MTTDLTRPVIIATVHGSDPGERLALLIGGTHRLYKATVQGRTHLPSFVLTEAETLAIRRRPHLGPAPAARQWAPGRGSRR